MSPRSERSERRGPEPGAFLQPAGPRRNALTFCPRRSLRSLRGDTPPTSPLPLLLLPPLDPVRHRRPAVAFIRDLRDEHRERLDVPGRPERAEIHGLEADVANQLGHDLLRLLVVAAVEEARRLPAVARVGYGEQDLTRNAPEGGDHGGAASLPGKLLRTGRPMRDDELRILVVHGEGAGNDDLARDVASLLQDVVHAIPVHREQEHVGIPHGFARRSGTGTHAGLAREPLELLLAA